MFFLYQNQYFIIQFYEKIYFNFKDFLFELQKDFFEDDECKDIRFDEILF